ncbi:MAG: response regulator [Chloroflexi bacterium]|nr:response regulator [Chloroflexota bacterium]
MRLGDAAKSAADYYSQPDLQELRDQALRLTVVGVGAVTVLGMLAMAGAPSAFDDSWIAPSMNLAAVVLLVGVTLLASSRSTTAGSVVLTTGIFLLITLALGTYPADLAAPWYVAAVIAATFLLGAWAGALASVGAIGLVALAASRPDGFSDPRAQIAVVFLIITCALLSNLATRPANTALAWAWQSYVQASEKTELLRYHQGDLNRTLKSLTDAYYRLEVASQELARARQAAEEARRLKAEFAANISHELRTPLNLIIGFSEMMVKAPHTYGDEALPAAYRADVEAIYRNARHLSSLIDDVLDLSQVDAGEMGLRKEQTGLTEVAREAAGAVAALFSSRGLSLRVEVPGELPGLLIDRTRIRQVFINLLNNAAKFTSRGGVTVTARQQDHDVVVAVTDTGIGMAPKEIPLVFEEFRQLDGSLRREQPGSGLGLAISKRFVELHGGSIWAESLPGQGSTFSFALPINQNVVSAPVRRDWETWVRLPPEREAPAELTAIVVLDEDPGRARLLQRRLDGYEVLAAASDQEAERLALRTRAQAIVAFADPDGDAQKRIRRLRQVPAGIALVVCSLPGAPDSSAQLGVVDYLVKPVAQERLVAALRRLGSQVRTILVVDDDPDMVRLLSRMIRATSRRYRVLRAGDGAEALDMLRERGPHAVLLDLALPGLDGYSLLEEMKRAPDLRGIPVVVVTAKGYESSPTCPSAITIMREGGLPLTDLVRCLKAGLSVMAPAGRNAGREPQPAPPG